MNGYFEEGYEDEYQEEFIPYQVLKALEALLLTYQTCYRRTRKTVPLKLPRNRVVRLNQNHQ